MSAKPSNLAPVNFTAQRKHKNKDGTFDFEVKGDDIYLANDLLVGAYENLYDTAILVSGDEDFIPVINTLKRLNKKTENAFFISTSSKKLRKLCDKAVNLKNIIDKSEAPNRSRAAGLLKVA